MKSRRPTRLNSRQASKGSLWRSKPPGPTTTLDGASVVRADCLAFLRSLRDESADLVFLDPPFNLGKTYGGARARDDRLTEREYFRQLCRVLDECVYKLRPGGALFFYHIPRWAIRFAPLLRRQLTFRHWIAIAMKNGFVRGKSLYPAHYALLYFTKGDPATFSRPKVAAPTCRHCGKYTKDYGGYKSFIADGINLSDVWDDLSPVRHRKFKSRSANELPAALTERIVSIAGRRRGLFVDVYTGSGSAAVAARKAGMRVVACDREPDHCALVVSRLRAQPLGKRSR
jgi:site-specific DNA-methyltransferase (adenine-specific)